MWDDPLWWIGLVAAVLAAVAGWCLDRGGYLRGYERGWLDAKDDNIEKVLADEAERFEEARAE